MRLLAVNGTKQKIGLFQPYLKQKQKDEYKITFTANYFPLGSLMYAQNFQKILYGMKSLMIIYTSKQRGYSQQTERANGIVCCRFFLLYKFKSKEIA
jgi:hypothetical protein